MALLSGLCLLKHPDATQTYHREYRHGGKRGTTPPRKACLEVLPFGPGQGFSVYSAGGAGNACEVARPHRYAAGIGRSTWEVTQHCFCWFQGVACLSAFTTQFTRKATQPPPSSPSSARLSASRIPEVERLSKVESTTNLWAVLLPRHLQAALSSVHLSAYSRQPAVVVFAATVFSSR